jgi:Ca2+-binding EF-hand superfamily protein
MAPFFNPFLGVPSMQAEQAAQADAFLAIDGGAGLQDVRGLLERFDGAAGDAAAESVAKDNVLTAAEFGVSPEALAEYDVDGSGGLDFDELRQWLRRPPADVTLLVHIGDAANATSLEFTARDTLSGGRLKLRPSSDGGRDTLSVGKVRLEFEGRVARLDAREQVVEPFDRADADGNGYIDLEESRRYVVYSQLFALVDADGDEKLFKAEAEAWADRWAPAFRSRVELAVADRGRRLFDILDANRDGRLGENELRAGAARIADWDADSDGLLVEQEVPGTWGISVAPINVARAVRGIGGGGEVRRIEASAAPNWFRRMDRNGDGLIAQREFLGPLADFSKFDADGDGYLSAAEAGD